MSFKLVLKGAYSQVTYEFLLAAGIRMEPFEAAQRVSLGDERLWELSRCVPRFLVEGNLQDPDELCVVLDVEEDSLESLDHLYEKPVPHLRLHVERNKCVIRREDAAPPGGKIVRVRDLAFWPRAPKENDELRAFFSPAQQQAA